MRYKLTDLPKRHHKEALEQMGHIGTPNPTESLLGANSAVLERFRGAPRPLLNKLEARFKAILESRGYSVMCQAITLRLDPPFRSYTADLAILICGVELWLFEVKGPHRFREKGIAKAALAAKTYPQIPIILADWDGNQWKESRLGQ